MSNKPAKISFSLIIPVYNRPDEIAELLESLKKQTFKDFEVIIVEDGSSVLSEKISRDYMGILNLKYYYKENSGPGPSRNYGMQKATGNYFIILDSDIIVPENYMQTVHDTLKKNYTDAYGGPDEAAPEFTPVQKAINYAMTSWLTTGGIRGKGQKIDKFYPRSFNMGISKEVFEQTGGFSDMRYGEDIDLSIRMMKAGFKTTLMPQAFVYHKRRNDWRSFFNQVKHSGEARIHLSHLHPGTLKLLHFFPAIFTIGFILSIILLLLGFYYAFLLYTLYFIILFIDATNKYKQVYLGFLSAFASFVMLLGYGWGFLKKLFTYKL